MRGELGRVELIVAHEGPDEVLARRGLHSFAVESGKEGAFHKAMEGKGSEGIFIGQTEPAFAVDRLGLEFARVPIEVLNWLHGGTLPLARVLKQG